MDHVAPSLLFENNAGQLLTDSAGFLRANWASQSRTPADTQELFTHIGRGLRAHRWSRVLVNQIGMPPFTAAEQEWIAHIWLPLAVRESGYRHGAVVLSPDVFVRLATAYITTHVQGLPLVYRSFDGEDEARQWLLKQPVAPVG